MQRWLLAPIRYLLHSRPGLPERSSETVREGSALTADIGLDLHPHRVVEAQGVGGLERKIPADKSSLWRERKRERRGGCDHFWKVTDISKKMKMPHNLTSNKRWSSSVRNLLYSLRYLNTQLTSTSKRLLVWGNFFSRQHTMNSAINLFIHTLSPLLLSYENNHAWPHLCVLYEECTSALCLLFPLFNYPLLLGKYSSAK